MDASPAQPQDVRDLVAAELAQKLLTELSGQQYLTRAEERTLDVAALWSLLQVIEGIAITIRRLMNTTRPVNQLPTEVLGHVFSFLPTRRTHTILSTSTTNVQDVRALLPMLSVCTRWRDVAHGASFLWDTVIDLPDVALRQDYLSLCMTRPIYVVSTIQGSLEWLLCLLRAQETRVQELYVTHEVKTSEHVPAILQISLPALRCCVVDGDRDEDLFRPTDSTTARAALLPNSKSLCALRLRWVRFMPPTSFPVLTVLHLAEIEHMRLIDLLRFLARTPLLQDLQLNRTAPKKLAAVDLSRWGHGRVRLRDLRRLVMEDHTSSYAIFGGEQTNALAQYQRGLLSNLSIPPACAHAVEGVAGSGLVGDLLAELWPAGEQCANQIRIQGRSPLAHTLKFVLHLSAEDDLDASFGVFEFSHLAGVPARTRLADALSSGHVFRNIQRLWIGPREHLEWLYKDIGHILPALSTVEAIVMDGCIMPSSFDALSKALAVSPDGTVQSAPSLSTLALDFGTRLALKPPYELGSVGVGAVYEMQRSRAAARHPLRRLIHLPHTGRRTAY